MDTTQVKLEELENELLNLKCDLVSAAGRVGRARDRLKKLDNETILSKKYVYLFDKQDVLVIAEFVSTGLNHEFVITYCGNNSMMWDKRKFLQDEDNIRIGRY